MTTENKKTHSKIDDMLIDQAVFGLTAHEEAELNRLMQQRPVDDTENPFMETAAIVQLALAAMDPENAMSERMPENLRTRLLSSAHRQ